MQISELIPGRFYDIRIKDISVYTEHYFPGEVKRRRYIGPFNVDGIPFIEVTDALHGDHLIAVDLIDEIVEVTDYREGFSYAME